MHYDEQRSHFVSKSETKEEEKDLWQTPERLYSKLEEEFFFDVDLCANEDNHLHYKYFTEKNSCLDIDWHFRAGFMNPPYSKTALFLQYASLQAEKTNITVVALVNANTDTRWFKDACKTANEIRLISGRIPFVKPSGDKVNGNTKGQCLIIWRGINKTPCQITLIDRDDLLC